MTIISINSRNVHLFWSVPPLEYHNGIIRKFYINITEVDTGIKFQRISFGTSLIISSLHPFYIYWFGVAAFTVDLGPFTEPSELQMPQDGKDIAASTFLLLLSLHFHSWCMHSPQLSSQQLHCSSPLITFNPSDMGCPSSWRTKWHNYWLYRQHH